MKLTYLCAAAMLFLLSSPCAANTSDWPYAWNQRQYAPTIEEIHHDNGQMQVSLSNGALLRLRPTYYYMTGWDKGDWNVNVIFRREFASIEELLALNTQERKTGYRRLGPGQHYIDFVEGQPCQIVLPITHTWELEKMFDPHEELELWGIGGYFYTDEYWLIPLNPHDTSFSQEPLRANLYEHPNDSSFFGDSHPSTTSMSFYAHAHLIEADLLQFEDVLEANFQLKYSRIYMLPVEMEDADLPLWEAGDVLKVRYLEDGQYDVVNLSKGKISLRVYLGDPVCMCSPLSQRDQ